MYMLHLTRMEEYTDNENNIFKEIKDMSRKKIIAGNWKMNMTPSQAVKLCEELKPLVARYERLYFNLIPFFTSSASRYLLLQNVFKYSIVNSFSAYLFKNRLNYITVIHNRQRSILFVNVQKNPTNLFISYE